MSRQLAAGSPNHTAAQAAWPLVLAFLRRHVESLSPRGGPSLTPGGDGSQTNCPD